MLQTMSQSCNHGSKHNRRRSRRSGHRSVIRRLLLEALESRRLLALDFGDAPNDGSGSLPDYPVTLAQNGARHEIVAGFCLGGAVDAEADGQPSAEATADDLTGTPDDEDGVTSAGGGGVLISGGLKRGDGAASFRVAVTNSAGVAHAYLDAWLDLNADGDWDDSGERIASRPVVAGMNMLSFAVPDDAALGQTYARFRLHSASGPGLRPTGPADAGEVEDHAVLITCDVTDPDQVAKLLAGDAAGSDRMGISVATWGDSAVVGADWNDDGGSDSGSAYVFARSGGNWIQQAKLIASDDAAEDYFGHAVAIWGDTAVVGAYGDDDGGAEAGSAYVFLRNGGVWTEQAKLTAADAAVGDEFGHAVAIWGDTIVVGAYRDDDAGNESGSAYVFTRSGTNWTQQAKLTAADAALEDRFGVSVAVSGDTVVVGSRRDDDGGNESGSAYVFTRSGSSWAQQAKLKAADAAMEDNFGLSVALWGDTAVVGANLNDDGGTESGSAYVFTRTGTSWVQQAKLTADDAAAGDQFGYSVAVSGDTAVVGAFRDDGGSTDSGSSYVFARSGTGWSQQAKLTAADAATSDYFGAAVAVWGDTAVVGAFGDDGVGSDSGSAFVFDLAPDDYGDAPNDGSGSLPDYPVTRAQNGARHVVVEGFSLGNEVDAETDGQPSVEANADDLTAAPDDEDAVSNVGGGGVMISGGLKRGDPAASLAVAVTNTAGVTHPYLDAWIDFNADGDWDDSGERIASQAVVAGTNTLTFAVPEDAAFGQRYARFRLHSATGPGLLPTGPAADGEVEDHAVLITWDVTDPDQIAKLLASDAAADDYFGESVAIWGDTAVVGASANDDAGSNSGSAYVFVRSGSTWTQQAKLTASDAAAGDYFGMSVAISGDSVVVGAYSDDDAGSGSGSAYVFNRTGSIWTQQAKLTAGGDQGGRVRF